MKLINLQNSIALLVLAFTSQQELISQTNGAATINTLGNVGTIGNGRCFIGSYCGNANTTLGVNNTFLGHEAGRYNNNQTDNVFVGYRAGYNNGNGDTETKAMFNTFVGSKSGYTNTSAGNNTFLGYASGYYNSVGDANTYIGTSAGFLGVADNNTFAGYECGYNNTGEDNTFFGMKAGRSNTTGTQNSIVGDLAGFSNATGNYNTIMGYQSGYGPSGGNNSSNSFFGYQSGYSITTGSNNVFLGYAAGSSNTSGGSNLFLGHTAGDANTTGSNNTILGYASDVGSGALSNSAAIGSNVIVKNSNDMILGDNSTQVGIGLSNDATGALSVLSVGGNGLAGWEIYGYNPSSGDGAITIRAEIDATLNSQQANKVYAVSGGVDAYYGYSYGVYGSAYKASAHQGGRAYGVYGIAGNCTNTYNYGVYGTITGSNTGFAGYFDGLLRTTNDSPEKVTNGSWTGYSDERLKQNVQPFEDGLDVIRQINPVTYQFNGVGGLDPTKTHVGVIAQDVQPIAPYCVGTSQMVMSQSDAGAFGGDVVMMINDSTPQALVNVMNYNYDGLIYAMINAIKELDSTVTALQAQIDPGAGLRMSQSDSLLALAPQQVTLNNSRAVLYQNIPNPAEGQTTINYYVSENARTAQMVFYDQFGREIKRVELENKGNGSLDVNTVDLQSGIYSYSLIVDASVIDTKQMIRTR